MGAEIKIADPFSQNGILVGSYVEEVRLLLQHLEGLPQLMAKLLYGSVSRWEPNSIV